jgi:hypothetical protein
LRCHFSLLDTLCNIYKYFNDSGLYSKSPVILRIADRILIMTQIWDRTDWKRCLNFIEFTQRLHSDVNKATSLSFVVRVLNLTNISFPNTQAYYIFYQFGNFRRLCKTSSKVLTAYHWITEHKSTALFCKITNKLIHIRIRINQPCPNNNPVQAQFSIQYFLKNNSLNDMLSWLINVKWLIGNLRPSTSSTCTRLRLIYGWIAQEIGIPIHQRSIVAASRLVL